MVPNFSLTAIVRIQHTFYYFWGNKKYPLFYEFILMPAVLITTGVIILLPNVQHLKKIILFDSRLASRSENCQPEHSSWCLPLHLRTRNSRSSSHQGCCQEARWCLRQLRPLFELSPLHQAWLPARQEAHWVRGLWRKSHTCKLTWGVDGIDWSNYCQGSSHSLALHLSPFLSLGQKLSASMKMTTMARPRRRKRAEAIANVKSPDRNPYLSK